MKTENPLPKPPPPPVMPPPAESSLEGGSGLEVLIAVALTVLLPAVMATAFSGCLWMLIV